MALIQNEVVASIQEGNIEYLKERVEESAEMSDEEFSESYGIDLKAVKIDKASYITKLLKKIERTEDVYQEATQAFAVQESKGITRWVTEKLAPEELQMMEVKNENMRIFRQQYFNSVMQMDNLDVKEKENADLLSELTNGEINYAGMRDLIETTAQEEAIDDRMIDLKRRVNENLDDTGKVIDEQLQAELEQDQEKLIEQRAILLDALSTQHEKTLKGQFDKQWFGWANKVQKQKGRVDLIEKAAKAKQEIDYARGLRNQAVQAFNALKTEDGRTALLEDIGRIEKLRRNDKHSGVLMREAKEMGMTAENYAKLYAMSQMPGLNEQARKAIRKKQADLMRMEKRYRTMFRNMSEEQLAEAFSKYSNSYIKQLILDEFKTRSKEAQIERDEERQRIEKEQEEQNKKDQKDKEEKERRESEILENENRRRDRPESEENIDDIEVIKHTDAKLIKLDSQIKTLEKLIEAEQATLVTPEEDRIAQLEETLDAKQTETVSLMREKGKSEEMINTYIRSNAKKNGAGNTLTTQFKAEDILANPENYSEALLINAWKHLYGVGGPVDSGGSESSTRGLLKKIKQDIKEGLSINSSSYTTGNKKGVREAYEAYQEFVGKSETLANLRGQRMGIIAQNKSKTDVIPTNPSNETARKQGQVISRNGQYINEDPQDRSPKFDENLMVTNHRDTVKVDGNSLEINRELLTNPDIASIETEVKLRVLPTDAWSAQKTKYPDYSTIPVGIFMIIEGTEVLVGTLGNHQGDAEFTAERQRIYNNWKQGKDTVAVIKKYETQNISISPAEGSSSSKLASNGDIQNYRNTEGLGVQRDPSEIFALSQQQYGQPSIGVITGSQFAAEGYSINLGMNGPNINVDAISVPKSAVVGSVGVIIKDPNGYDLFIPMQTRELGDNAINTIINNALSSNIRNIEEITYADYSVTDLIEWGYTGSVVPPNASSLLANTFYKVLAKKDSEGNFRESTHLFYTPYKDSMVLVGASNQALKDSGPVKMYTLSESGGFKVVPKDQQPAGLPDAETAMRVMLSRKKYQVDASKFNNTNLQYESPVTGISYDNYQEYLKSEQESKNEQGEIQARRNGAEGSSSAILGSDVLVRKTKTPRGNIHRSIHANVNIAMYLPELDNFKGKESNTDLVDPISYNEVLVEQAEKNLEKQVADMLNIPTFDPSQIDFTGGVIPGAMSLENIEEDIINKEAKRFKEKQEKVDPIKTNETTSETTADELLDNDIDNIPDSEDQNDGIIGNEKEC
tara:strand:- start:5467 stop:9228 length:3762 start_codon:yes stop_codon:yes gene_type:complete